MMNSQLLKCNGSFQIDTWRKPMQTQGKLANSTQKGPELDTILGTCCWEVTVLNIPAPCHHLFLSYLHNTQFSSVLPFSFPSSWKSKACLTFLMIQHCVTFILILTYPGIEMEIVNSCETNNGGCSHHCEHTTNGPLCSCNHGYRLDQDRKTCIGKNLLSVRCLSICTRLLVSMCWVQLCSTVYRPQTQMSVSVGSLAALIFVKTILVDTSAAAELVIHWIRMAVAVMVKMLAVIILNKHKHVISSSDFVCSSVRCWWVPRGDLGLWTLLRQYPGNIWVFLSTGLPLGCGPTFLHAWVDHQTYQCFTHLTSLDPLTVLYVFSSLWQRAGRRRGRGGGGRRGWAARNP